MTDPQHPLPMIELPRLGRSVSRFALGGFHQLEITTDLVAEVVDAYLACGGTYIETARGYGKGASEEKLGHALEGRRDEVVLVSKSGAATADDIRRDLERSLEALRTDRLDIYFFHGATPEKLDRLTAPGGAVEGLTKAIDEGILAGMGLSSHVPATYVPAMERIDLAVILIWCNYLDNLNFPAIPERIIPAARRLGVGVTAMKPLADGMLWQSAERAVRCSMAAGADVVVCGTNSVEQVRQVAAAVAAGPADKALREEILRTAPELGRYVCRRCGQCPAEVMDTFRLEGEFDRQLADYLPHDPADYALRQRLRGWYGRADAARAAFAEAGTPLDALLQAAEGVACPYDIDIPRKLRLAVAKLTDGAPERV
ncbi:MAG: aldo/keto reductase [Planctomycetota bacterium]